MQEGTKFAKFHADDEKRGMKCDVFSEIYFIYLLHLSFPLEISQKEKNWRLAPFGANQKEQRYCRRVHREYDP